MGPPNHNLPTFESNLSEYAARGEDIVARPDLFLARFRSPDGLRVFPDSDVYDNRTNREFMIRIYPPRGGGKVRRAAIMFNGLDETLAQFKWDEEATFRFYDDLGRRLGEMGMLAILLPTPYHMNRIMTYRDRDPARVAEILRNSSSAPDSFKFVDMTQPTEALVRNSRLIYRNHYQGFRETVALLRCVKGDRSARLFPRVAFTKTYRPFGPQAESLLLSIIDDPLKLRVSLIGYSLGGLRAMSEYLRDRYEMESQGRDPAFDCCVLINSGGGLQRLPAPSWVEKERWDSMITELVPRKFGLRKERRTDFTWLADDARRDARDHCQFLKDVFLGDGDSFNTLTHVEAAQSFLFVMGGADAVVPPESLKRFAPNGGLNLLQIAGMGHFVSSDDAFARWKGIVFDIIANFLRHASPNVANGRHRRLARRVALFDHEVGILPGNTNFLKDHKRVRDALAAIDSRSNLLELLLGKSARRLVRSKRLALEFRSYCIAEITSLENEILLQRVDKKVYRREHQALAGLPEGRRRNEIDAIRKQCADDFSRWLIRKRRSPG